MLNQQRLQILAARLAGIHEPDCQEAHAVVVAALDDSKIGSSSMNEYDLYHTVWGHITRALDHAMFAPELKMQLDALEAEMAGRVLGIRLLRGDFNREQ
jgi:hypothetical protein